MEFYEYIIVMENSTLSFAVETFAAEPALIMLVSNSLPEVGLLASLPFVTVCGTVLYW